LYILLKGRCTMTTRNSWLVVFIAASLIAGCGSNVTGPKPINPTTGPYGFEFTFIIDDSTLSVDDITFRVADQDTIRTFPVPTQRIVKVEPLDRGVEYDYTLWVNGKRLDFNIGGKTVSSFTRRVDEGEDITDIEIPIIHVLPKPVVPTTGDLVITTNPGATVLLGDDEWVVPADGTIRISGLEPGVYVVEVTLDGHTTQEKQCGIQAGQTTEQTFELEPLPNVFEGFVNRRIWMIDFWDNEGKRNGGWKVVIDITNSNITFTSEGGSEMSVVNLDPSTGEFEFSFGREKQNICHGFYSRYPTEVWEGTTNFEQTFTITLF